MDRIETFFGALVLALLAWWWLGSAGADLPVVGSVVQRLHIANSFATETASASSQSQVRAPASPDHSAADSDREWRRARAEESARLAAERDAAYERAQAEYDRQRDAIATQIAQLEGSNKGGCNNTAIQTLVSQRSSLALPQR